MDLFNGKIQRYYGETDADFLNRVTYEFMNREDENTTYPGVAAIWSYDYTPNSTVQYYGKIPYYCQKRKVMIDIKNPEASFLAAERLVAPFHLACIDWTACYHGIGWRDMIATREDGKIVVKELRSWLKNQTA